MSEKPDDKPKDEEGKRSRVRFSRIRAPEEPLPYPDSDIPPALQRTLKRRIEEGDEAAVSEEELRAAVRRAVRRRPD